jgi:hypothetical protein
VPVVPGVLLDHVLEDPPQRGRAGRSRCKIIQAVTLDGCASPVMCRTRPSSDRLDGRHERAASCSGSSPAHFTSSVARWNSSHVSSEVRSSRGVLGVSMRFTGANLACRQSKVPMIPQ